MHRHLYVHYDKTRTRLWHKVYEDDMKMTSSFNFVPSRVNVGLNENVFRKIGQLTN